MIICVKPGLVWASEVTAHRTLAKRLMHIAHISGNTSRVSKSSSNWLNYRGFPGDLCVTFFKGIVHPKMKNSVIYSPSSSSKPLWMSLFCWTQRKIFWRMWETEQFWGTIDLIVFFSYYGSQWCPKTAWLQTFFKISSFVFGRTKKCIQVWNYLRVSKWWQNCWLNFWVNYPFNVLPKN